ncbi:hypothetical protein VP01_4722g1 [Puccinia sorghi]|uniref:Uncharacterized protein n=1 Tax=Puccinia sorghi TaxID=27349 RepID=A0A0L6UPY4_9BASI|nr:hypothetical protein VP01_4722g1 [Puccinia sorghi]
MSTPVEIPNPNVTQPPKQPQVVVQDGVCYYPLRDEWSPAWISTQLPANLASPKSEGLDLTTKDIPVPPSFTNVERRNLPSASSRDRASSWGAAPPPTPVPSVNYLEFDLEAVQQVLVANNPTPLASQYYREDNLFLIFDSIANEFIQYTRLRPASTQAELDACIHFLLNIQWAF